MSDKTIKRSKVLEMIRDSIDSLPEFHDSNFNEKSLNVVQEIRRNLKTLSSVVPNFKKHWHMIRFAIYYEAPLSIPLEDLADVLDIIIPKEKEKENSESSCGISCRIQNFSSELSDLLESISDLEEDVKNLYPEILCTLQELATLTKELEQTINSKISSK